MNEPKHLYILMKFEYPKDYIPQNCSKPRRKNIVNKTFISVPSVSSDDAPIAMYHQNYLFPNTIKFRLYGGRLYKPSTTYKDTKWGRWLNIQDLIQHLSTHKFLPHEKYNTVEEYCEKCQQLADNFLIINDMEVWELAGEPRYVIEIVEMGNNLSYTELTITHAYKDNVRRDFYFNALDRERAVQRCIEVALARGDTFSVEYIKNSWPIEVLIPEAVKCRPEQETGPKTCS